MNGAGQPGRHRLAQAFGQYDENVVAMPQDVHDDFGVAGVRHFQFVAAIPEPLAGLIRVPFLSADPLRRLRLKHKGRPMPLCAGVDAVTTVHLGLYLELELPRSR